MGIGTMALLAIGSGVLAGVSAFAQAGQAKAMARAEEEAAQQQWQLQQEELTRQQREAQETAAEERSDVVRRASRELGTIRAMAGDMGASSGAFARMVAELGGSEGIDLARINRNRDNRVDSLQASKKGSSQEYTNRVTYARNQASAAKTNAVLGFAGSALQIGSGYYQRQQELNILQNRRVN